MPKYRKPSKSFELAVALKHAKSEYDRAQKAVEQANSGLFSAQQALDKAQAEYTEHLKSK